MGGRTFDLPSRRTCGLFCGSNGILWSVSVLLEFQKQSGMIHITRINRPPRSWFRRWLRQECQLQFFELLLAASVRERPPWPKCVYTSWSRPTCFTQSSAGVLLLFQVICPRCRCPLFLSPSSFPWRRCCARSSLTWTPPKSLSARRHLSITWAKPIQVIHKIFPQFAC